MLTWGGILAVEPLGCRAVEQTERKGWDALEADCFPIPTPGLRAGDCDYHLEAHSEQEASEVESEEQQPSEGVARGER